MLIINQTGHCIQSIVHIIGHEKDDHDFLIVIHSSLPLSHAVSEIKRLFEN